MLPWLPEEPGGGGGRGGDAHSDSNQKEDPLEAASYLEHHLSFQRDEFDERSNEAKQERKVRHAE